MVQSSAAAVSPYAACSRLSDSSSAIMQILHCAIQTAKAAVPAGDAVAGGASGDAATAVDAQVQHVAFRSLQHQYAIEPRDLPSHCNPSPLAPDCGPAHMQRPAWHLQLGSFNRRRARAQTMPSELAAGSRHTCLAPSHQVQRLATRQRVVAGRAERVGAALSGGGIGGDVMPDAWEVAYEDALDLARTAAVQETLANQAASRHAYLQVRHQQASLSSITGRVDQ